MDGDTFAHFFTDCHGEYSMCVYVRVAVLVLFCIL